MKTEGFIEAESKSRNLTQTYNNEGVTQISALLATRPTLSNKALGKILNKGLASFYFDVVKVAMQKPRWFATAVGMYIKQRAAAKKRIGWENVGTHIPPFMIMSITKSCNLRCKGCYSHSLHTSSSPILSNERITEILAEARQLGISTVLLAGGEPLTNKNLLDITAGFPEITFPLFTNGTMIDKTVIAALKKQRNVVPVLSIEGNRKETDERRGRGVYDQVESTMSLLRKNGLFFGSSITVTSENFPMVYDSDWIGKLYQDGCRLFFHVEYVPVDKGTETLVLSDLQRSKAMSVMAGLKKQIPALFVAFPGDEDLFGGCLAAGRGFIHISPSGDLEPCPFAPYTDRNVSSMTLKSALGSPLLDKIRANHGNLQETSGGCALWAEREWVSSLTNAS